jgi:hypothetical protein
MMMHDVLDHQGFARLAVVPDMRRKIRRNDQESHDNKKRSDLDPIKSHWGFDGRVIFLRVSGVTRCNHARNLRAFHPLGYAVNLALTTE